MRVLLVKEPGCIGKYIVNLQDINSVVFAFFQDSDPGDKLILELAEMDQEEIKELSEFDGCI